MNAGGKDPIWQGSLLAANCSRPVRSWLPKSLGFIKQVVIDLHHDDTVEGRILHHLGCRKPCKYWDQLPYQLVSRISSINSIDDIVATMTSEKLHRNACGSSPH